MGSGDIPQKNLSKVFSKKEENLKKGTFVLIVMTAF
jgi:hypothetical protein